MRAASLARYLAAVVLVLAGAYASAQVITTGALAAYPLAARSIGVSSNAVAQSALAQLALFEGNPAGAIEPARRSLAIRPLDPTTLRSLAVARIETADNVAAARTLTLASQLGWRDIATQVFLLEVTIRAGDAKAAAIRVDALARQRPQLVQTIEQMRRVVQLPGGPEAMAGRLVGEPGWRRLYLPVTDGMPAAAYRPWMAMLASLNGTAAPPQPGEYGAFERELLAKGEVALAIEASRKVGALRRSAASGFGVIAQGDQTSPFGWSVEPGREASVSQPARGALQASVDGQTGGELVRRVFALTPGPHRLTVRVDEASAQAARALRWTVTCLPSGISLDLAASRREIGGDGTIEEVAFVVPTGCLAARVALASQAGQVRDDYALTLSNLRLD
jgi:hypothetical protein